VRGIPLGVALVAAGLYLVGLGAAPFLDPPEGFHAAIAREMALARDWAEWQPGPELEVIASRHAAHAEAKRRLEIVDAELGRLRQQISLVREQTLLATDENTIATSLDALSASLNEANRWLKDQRELFAGIENFTDEPPPADLLASRRAQQRTSKKVME